MLFNDYNQHNQITLNICNDNENTQSNDASDEPLQVMRSLLGPRFHTCPMCVGTGKVKRIITMKKCPACAGSGKILSVGRPVL